MWPDRVSNPGPLTYESGALPTALRGPAGAKMKMPEFFPFCSCTYDVSKMILKCNDPSRRMTSK